MRELMPITPKLLTWARDRAGYSQEEISTNKYFKKIKLWENGEQRPTYSQLAILANKFKVPVAVFFFPEPPELPPIDESFRTLEAKQLKKIPPRIRLLLRKALAFQLGLQELHFGNNPADRLITKDLTFQPTDSVDKIAKSVRNYLNVSFEEQYSWKNSGDALQNWRKILLDVGVNVFKDSFKDDEYSGFCLFHQDFPIIYVNNSTAKTRQIFTLFHELAHLLFNSSGLDTPKDSYLDELPANNKRIEIICNKMAAQFLVPDNEFDKFIDGVEPTQGAFELSKKFSVSRELIFRKFLDRGLITQELYDEKTTEWSKKTAPSNNAGNFYNTKIAYLGLEYITLAFQRYYQNIISENQLAEYLDTKPKYLTQLEETILPRVS
ncbi:MAG: ImmA/IrrE family metallo-endopeptidase [Rhodobacteraceae bacterium]|nr:ImmA/IrrE family metallo-endopeptidase [Paracoccaceae bacterium]